MGDASEEWDVLEHNSDLEFRPATPGGAKITWLKYQPGYVTTAPLLANSMPVLTGKMSGCWVVKYSHGGNDFVAHVGTDSSNPVLNTRAKNSWNNFVTSNNTVNVTGFNPSRDWPVNIDRSSPDLYAIVDTNGNFYDLEVMFGGNNTSSITGFHPIVSTLPANGQIR
eukprot:CAMPEP_0195508932 /NCGR_PEP_ID=MMETSP0794_2-20130614/2017_1 /TAXON_ID=515487 /ORGANISM="Stephanopyxis turris, Strain CCMP 815" /LENGTH=166 /DNA_ID=CAMNT_0040636033 /DNA_START=143 /DNA_END=643 /DNA_ORIENTATION=+